MANFDFTSYGKSGNTNDISGLLTPLDLQLQALQQSVTTPTLSSTKEDRLQQRKAIKDSKFNKDALLTTATKDQFYDADTVYQPGAYSDGIRLGDPTSSKALYINAPEKKFGDREPTPEEAARYNASRMALDNFAMGTTPASLQSFQDLIANPLTPENQQIYNTEMAKLRGDELSITGNTGHLDIHGRQVGQVFNPSAPNANESLENRLYATGNAEYYSHGKPVTITDGKDTTSTISALGIQDDAYEINPADIAINYAVEAVGFIPEVLAAAADGGIWIGNKINKATGSTELDFSVLDKVREAKDAVKEFAGLDDTAYNAATNEAIDNLYEVYSNDKLDTTDKLAAFSGILYDNANLVPQLTADSYQFVKQMMTGLASGNGLQAIDKIYAKLRPATEKSQSIFNKLGTKYDQMQVKADQASRLATAGKLGKIKNLQIQGTNAILRGAGAPKTLIDTADTLDEIEKNGGDVTLGRAIATFSIKFGENKLDSFIDRATMGMSKQGKAVYSKIGEVFNKLPKTPTLGEAQSVKAGLVAVLSRTLKEAGKIGTATAGGLVVEGVTEAIQEVVSMYNERYDTDLFRDKEFLGMFDEEGQKQIVGAFGLGMLGAAGQTSIGQASGVINKATGLAGEVKDKLTPKATKVKDQVKAAQDKFSNIKTDDIAAAGASIHQMGKDTVDGVRETFKGTKEAGAAYIVTNPDSPASEFTAVDEADDKYNNDDVKAAAAEFDTNYSALVNELSNTLQQAKEVTDEKAKEGEIHEFGPQIAPMIVSALEPLKVALQAAKDAGAGPQRIKHMESTIAKLAGVAQVQTQDEMASIMSSNIDAKSKASVILGSSDEAFKSSDGTVDVTVIDNAINDTAITTVQKKLLEYKKNVIQNAANPKSKAAMEKVYGSGSKRGLLDYANELVGGTLTSTSMERLEKFAQSQVDKLQMYQEAVNDWKEANPDKSPAYEDKTTLSNGTEYSVNGAQSVVDAITAEQVYIDELLSLAKNPNASQKVPEEPVKGETPVEDTTTPVEEEKAPEASGEEKRLAKLYNIASDVANGRPLSKKDTEFAKNNKQAITKLIKEDESLNNAQKETRKRNKTAPKGTTKPPKEETVPEPEFDTTVEEEIDVAALNEEARNTSPESQKPTNSTSEESKSEIDKAELKEPKTTIKVTELNAELANIQEDIRYLEEAKESETLSERVITNREIAKLEKKADTILAKLGLEGTVGDIILSNPAPKRKKSGLIKGEKEVQLSDFFEVKKTYNNLVHKLFTKPFTEVQQIVGFTDDEAAYVVGAQVLTRNTAKYIRKFIKDDFDQSGISDLDVTDTTKEPYQSISRLLLLGEPGNYTLPAEVVGAMAVSINDWIVGYSSLRASVRTDEDTDRIFGSNNKEDRAKVANIDGLVTTVANSLGAKIYKELGLKVIKVEGTNREILEAKMKLELGLMAMEAMKSNNLIEINTVDAVDVFPKDSLGNDTRINVFTMTGAADTLNSPVDSKNLSINSRYATKLLGGGTQMRYPSTTEPTTDRKVKNSSDIGKYYKAAKETEEAVNKQEQTTWEWTKEYVESYMDMVKDPEGRDRLKVLLGWKEPKEHHILLQPGINGKNQAIESDMQFLEDWYNEMQATGKEQMWFPYKLVKNGRFILDSNTFNPQGKKLHRFAVHSHVATITDKTKDNHSLALAMAFGVDIDKKTKDSAIKEWEAIDNELNNLIEEGFTDLEILETAIDKGWTHDVPHTLGGIIEYRRYNEYIKKNETVEGFKSTLPIETDAVTSGFILKLLQMPILKDVKKFLAKGGVFLDSDGTEGFGKQAEEPGFDDAYNTPAEVMKKALKPVLKNLKSVSSSAHTKAVTRASELALGVSVDEDLGTISRKAARKFMKSPFMTFNYGAGISTIITSIGDDAIESLYTKLTSDNKKDVAQAINIIANSRVGMEYKDGAWVASNKVSQLEDLRTMSKAARLSYILPKAIEDNIRSNISASVGVALEETFNKEYAPFIEAAETINKSFVVMFRLFKHKVDKEINTKQDSLGRYLTTDEITEVYTKHAKSMPAIRTALGTEVSKMMIFSTQATNYTPTDSIKESGQGKVRLAGKDNYLSGQAKFYEMVEADKAGAVIPIHYIDGSIQSIVLNAFDVLGVHDANMFYSDNVVEGTRKYNEATARTATEYSLTDEILKSIDETISNSDKEAIDAVDASLKEEFKGDKDLAPSVQIVQQDMQVLKDKATKGREEIFSKDIRFEHAAYEGSHYDMKGKAAIITESKTNNGQSDQANAQVRSLIDCQ